MARTVEQHSIGRAISRGRSGVDEVQGLLTRQPSVRPPVKARTSSGSVQQLQQTQELAAVPRPNSVFAADAAAAAIATPATHKRDQSMLPPLAVSSTGSAGTAGISGTAGLTRNLSVSAPAATKAAVGLKGQSRLPLALQESAAKPAAISLQQANNADASGTAPELQLSIGKEAAVSADVHGRDTQDASSSSTAARSYQCQAEEARGRDEESLPSGTRVSTLTFQTAQQAQHGPSNALSDVQLRRQSSASRTRSVTFGGAAAAAPGAVSPTSSASQPRPLGSVSAQARQQGWQASYPEREQEAQIGLGRGSNHLSRLPSSLAAAVSKTMQERMLAGGMMHRHTDAMHDDRCAWPRSLAGDSSQATEVCIWPRSILKHTADVQRDGLPSSAVGKASGNFSLSTAGQDGRSMPSQLTRHRSSLNQVSKRPDFAAAMNAVRASWREEEIGQAAAEVLSVKPPALCAGINAPADKTQSSLDAVWASISHQQ